MTDQVPVQQGTPSAQPTVDWEARYKGASTKINSLNDVVANLQSQITQLTSDTEQLKAQLTAKDVEKDAATGAFKTQIEAANQAKIAAEGELATLRALQKKVEIAKRNGFNDLLPVLDKIPTLPDETEQEKVLRDFHDWGKGMASQRESQIMSGTTPTVVAPAAKKDPTTAEEWMREMYSVPEGPQREAVKAKFFEWGRNQK